MSELSILTVDVLKETACTAIDQAFEELKDISNDIWKNPELLFEEHFAHKTLTDFLEKHGFPIERNYVLKTGFHSAYGTSKKKSDRALPNVAVLCEYDALPEIGHACGHNLIAEVGVAVALGIKAALDAAKDAGQKFGTLTVLGTPAEEGGCGKGYMIKSGAFDSVDAAMMAHPSSGDEMRVSVVAAWMCEVTYEGKASQAAAFPWEGVNALDEAVMAYTSISVLRQQMKPTWRVHGVITSGGAKPNIIPEKTKLQYIVRAPIMKELLQLKEKVSTCFKSSAEATGCEVTVKWDDIFYQNMITNETLATLVGANGDVVGFKDGGKPPMAGGATDMGNVSHVVPSIHPFYRIGDAPIHTREFAHIAGDPAAQQPTIIIAKALAMTAIDIYSQPHLVDKMKAELKLDLEAD